MAQRKKVGTKRRAGRSQEQKFARVDKGFLDRLIKAEETLKKVWPLPFHAEIVREAGGPLKIHTGDAPYDTILVDGHNLGELISAYQQVTQRPVTEQRQPVYGHPALNFSRQAISWTGKLANKLIKPLSAQDVAIMMADVKLCRLIESPDHEDSILDVGGYMTCLEQVNAVAHNGTDGSGIRSESVAQQRALRKQED